MLDISFLTKLFYVFLGFQVLFFFRILLLNATYRKEQKSHHDDISNRIRHPDFKASIIFSLTVAILVIVGFGLLIYLIMLGMNYTPANEEETLSGLSYILSLFPLVIIHHIYVLYNLIKHGNYYFQGLKLRLVFVKLSGSEKKKVLVIYAGFVVFSILFTIVGLVLLAALRNQYY